MKGGSSFQGGPGGPRRASSGGKPEGGPLGGDCSRLGTNSGLYGRADGRADELGVLDLLLGAPFSGYSSSLTVASDLTVAGALYTDSSVWSDALDGRDLVGHFEVCGNFGVLERVRQGGGSDGGGGPVGRGAGLSVKTMLSAGTKWVSTASRQVITRRVSLFGPTMQ